MLEPWTSAWTSADTAVETGITWQRVATARKYLGRFRPQLRPALAHQRSQRLVLLEQRQHRSAEARLGGR